MSIDINRTTETKNPTQKSTEHFLCAKLPGASIASGDLALDGSLLLLAGLERVEDRLRIWCSVWRHSARAGKKCTPSDLNRHNGAMPIHGHSEWSESRSVLGGCTVQ